MTQPNSPPASSKGVLRSVLRPRYSFIDLAILILVIAVVLGFAYQRFTTQIEALKTEIFRSPLAEVTLRSAGPPLSEEPAYRQDYEFTQDWFTPNIPIWESALAPYKDKPNLNYLEVGLYEGRASLWTLENILSHPSSGLTGIDLFDGELKERFFQNLARSGMEERATILIESSQTAMRTLPLESFDIIYIDGSHATADVLEDAVLSYRLLKPGGVLIFDDYQWAGSLSQGALTQDKASDFPKIAIDSFVQCFSTRLKVIHNSNQLILKKNEP